MRSFFDEHINAVKVVSHWLTFVDVGHFDAALYETKTIILSPDLTNYHCQLPELENQLKISPAFLRVRLRHLTVLREALFKPRHLL